ncbi:MAG: alpha/beta fold hydrolase, partial [Acidimicrobiia bacterium]|nr:alpha/beta fold hydrolase [Acidimicrobiia bacterium]
RLNLLFHDPEKDVSDELVEVRHEIYHTPEFVAGIDNLLALQELEIRRRNLLQPDRLARIEAETLVVWGTNNPFGAVPEAQAMADAIPNSRLEIFPDCGHWPQHEHPERFNDLSVRFLRGEL